MSEDIKGTLEILFRKWAGEEIQSITLLPQSGSYREYYRINGLFKNALGVYNADSKENKAFIEFSKHFFKLGISVPEIFAEQLEKSIYLIEDLGDETLFTYITSVKEKNNCWKDELLYIYKCIIDVLPEFQIKASLDIDYSFCYPRLAFDKQSMMWDLNYFKYYFLKLARIPFDEQLLEDDFQTFSDYLLKAERNYFLYRDFQSRNIMLVEGKPYFIDYQGGRKGALQYDLASLLYDAKADIPQETRNELLEYYMDTVGKYIPIDRKEFKDFYNAYVLIRIMQAMGAYGFRGIYEKKEHFLKSIPYAIKNLRYLLDTVQLPVKVSSLWSVLEQITVSDELKKYDILKIDSDQGLTVSITSFSYKKGIPEDSTGNGGGFVFDCRAIHNPGRYDEYKNLTGRDRQVEEFFSNRSEMSDFLDLVFSISEQSVEKYLQRNFKNLMINFGCTGGQHRSVYAAEKLAQYLKAKYNLYIILYHREQEIKIVL